MTRAEAIAKIEREYAKIREDNAQTLDERILEVRSACPDIGKLLDGMTRRFEESTRLVLANRADAREIAAKMKAKSLRDRAKIRKLLSQNGFSDTYLDAIYTCPDCKDTGYADQAHIQRCHCFEKRLSEVLFGLNDSFSRFENFNPDIYPGETQRLQGIKARDICEKYADEYPNGEKLNLVLVGKSGLGKTFFLDSIYHRVIQRGFTALRVSAFRMLEIMRAYHFGDVGDDSQLNAMIKAPLLLIDDLGTEPMLKNITVEYLSMLINERIHSRKHTVYATNLTSTQIAEQYGERVFSRLFGKNDSIAIQLQGDDLRIRGKQ